MVWGRQSCHPRDVQIVDMRNRGLSAAEIADALGTTEAVIRKDLRRLAIGLGENG
jgi:DNA-binding CsgD family transcriptional regulator